MAGTARKRGAGGTVLKAAAGLNLVTNYLLTKYFINVNRRDGRAICPRPDPTRACGDSLIDERRGVRFCAIPLFFLVLAY